MLRRGLCRPTISASTTHLRKCATPPRLNLATASTFLATISRLWVSKNSKDAPFMGKVFITIHNRFTLISQQLAERQANLDLPNALTAHCNGKGSCPSRPAIIWTIRRVTGWRATISVNFRWIRTSLGERGVLGRLMMILSWPDRACKETRFIRQSWTEPIVEIQSKLENGPFRGL